MARKMGVALRLQSTSSLNPWKLVRIHFTDVMSHYIEVGFGSLHADAGFQMPQRPHTLLLESWSFAIMTIIERERNKDFFPTVANQKPL